ncbi:hypothetical protein JHU38_05910 [Prevotella sp. A2931]|uniref:Uncharacterized protein n=1 Tax=Prevotella illustrans TaxID=2800387 RepID=A0ABS3M5B0_9BACT|nr:MULTISPECIES: hypothetical protein [Prevotella]MBO1363310.1 hypothetical protein [Prevotella illustrans]PTL25822.1 hypothetical protein C3V39_01250 [Prevotella sp. oral taxon 820]
MESAEKRLNTFSTRVRQLIIQYQELKNENADLYTMVDERDIKIKQLEEQLDLAKKSYESLKIARMIEVSDTDMESAKKRLSKLIRDVNKCLTLLSEK